MTGGRVHRRELVRLTPDADLVPGVEPGVIRLWPYTQSWRRLWRSTRPASLDPVNGLVLAIPPAALHSRLLANGWHRPGDGATHRTWVNGAFRHMVDHAALGDRAERVHVRLFRLAEHTLLAAHHEVADARGHHRVTSWDRAREEVGTALERAGFAALAPTAVVTVPNLRGVPGDGRVWRWVGVRD